MLLLLTLLAVLSGCATAVPVLGGATTTPLGQAEVAVGGASRIPLGDLEGPGSLEDAGQASGVAPVAIARFGLGHDTDLSVMAAGPALHLGVRQRFGLHRTRTERYDVLITTAAYGGYLENAADEGALRVGGDLPVLFAASIASLVEIYVGPRFGVEYVSGELAGNERYGAQSVGLKAGGTLGLGTGFKNFHAMVELTAQYESWSTDVDMGAPAPSLDASGLALTPAFALALRF